MKNKLKKETEIIIPSPNKIINNISEKTTSQEVSAEFLIAKGIEKNLPVETMERLLAMRRELKAEKAKEEFIKAITQFQSECPIIIKTKIVLNKDGKTERYRYAPIESIIEQVKKILASNGLSYSFDEIKDEKFTSIICTATHIFGHSEKTAFKIPIGAEEFMSDVQKHGARMTFGKRYAFCNAFGILTGDEDNDAKEDNEVKKSEPKKEIKKTKEEYFEQIKKSIGVAKDTNFLIGLSEKIKEGNFYTEKQKSELQALINNQIDIINEKN